MQRPLLEHSGLLLVQTHPELWSDPEIAQSAALHLDPCQTPTEIILTQIKEAASQEG